METLTEIEKVLQYSLVLINFRLNSTMVSILVTGVCFGLQLFFLFNFAVKNINFV